VVAAAPVVAAAVVATPVVVEPMTPVVKALAVKLTLRYDVTVPTTGTVMLKLPHTAFCK